MKIKLRENEEIILKSKKHWITIIAPLIYSLITLVISIFITVLFEITPFVGVIISLLLLVYKLIEKYTSYWILTNKRIIDKHGVFSVNSKETQIEKINNVTYHKPFLGRIFGYGTVRIQSAAEAGAMIHRLVQNPRKLKDTIIELQEQRNEILSTGINVSNTKTVKKISDEIEHLYDLNKKGIISDKEFEIAKRKVLGDKN